MDSVDSTAAQQTQVATSTNSSRSSLSQHTEALPSTDNNDRIRVCVRVRPQNERENAVNSTQVWLPRGNDTVYYCNPQTGTADSNSPVYTFDRVFSTDSTTHDLYCGVAQDIVLAACNGFNGTIFAYGQTSSGKTHTMKGSDTETGVIGHTVNEIFQYIADHQTREFLLRVSYLEIYNENIIDLLQPGNSGLKIHESIERGVYVGGLREEVVGCPEQILQLLEFGESHRRFGATNMNERSSRSHTIFRVSIESREKMMMTTIEEDEQGEENTLTSRDGGEDTVLVSTLNLVDLAGSERSSQTLAEGVRLTEGNHINKSLLTLGTVIAKLSSEGSRAAHIPYRDSRLTRILQPALGGNSRTAIICTITPALMHAEETHSTLKFANRAKNITNRAQINEVMNERAMLKRAKQESVRLQQKCDELQEQLQQAEEHGHVQQQRLNFLEQQVHDLQTKLLPFHNSQSWQEKYEVLAKEMNQACESWSKRYEALQQELTLSKETWEKTQAKMESEARAGDNSWSNKCEELQQQVKVLLERVRNVEQENGYFRSKFNTTQKQLQDQELHYQDEFERLDAEKTALQEKIEMLETENRQLKVQEQSDGANLDQIEKYVQEIQTLRDNINHLETEMKQKVQQHELDMQHKDEEWQTKLNAKITELQEAHEQQTVEAQRSSQVLEEQRLTLQQEQEDTHKKALEEQAKSLVDSHAIECEKLREQLSKEMEEFEHKIKEEAANERKSLESRLDSIQKTADDLHNQIETEKNEKLSLATELEKWRQSTEELEEELASIKDQQMHTLSEAKAEATAKYRAKFEECSKRIVRLKEAFQRQIQVFRSLVFRLFGYRIDTVDESRFKLHANRDEHLIVEFDLKSKKLELSEAQIQIRPDIMQEWRNSFPTFMSLLTLDLLAYRFPSQRNIALTSSAAVTASVPPRVLQRLNSNKRQPFAMLDVGEAADTEDSFKIHSPSAAIGTIDLHSEREIKRRKLNMDVYDENIDPMGTK